MARNFKNILILVIGLIGLFVAKQAYAQGEGTPKEKQDQGGEDEVSTKLVIHKDDGIFNSNATFSFDVKNTYKIDEEGTVSYEITTDKDEVLKTEVRKVKILPHTTSRFDFTAPSLKPGFYKLNLMINVADYDDTTRRAFGIRADEIRSAHKRPADFDAFWQKAKDELAKVKPDYKVTEMTEMNTDNRRVFLIEMRSLDNLLVRGWMTLPKTNDKKKKFAVLVGLPGYFANLKPLLGYDTDLAIFTLNVRGSGNSRDVLHPVRNEYISYNVEDKNKYIMRGAIMDCIRMIDFIYTRPELRHDAIMASGGSMGGYLAIALSSLDKRITICSAQNPVLSDVHHLDGAVKWPVNDMKKSIMNRGVTFEQVLNNLDYYDTKNFASTITCPTILGIGLLDPFVPPNNGYIDFNEMHCDKRIFVYKDLGHEVSQEYMDYQGRWMRDHFGLF